MLRRVCASHSSNFQFSYENATYELVHILTIRAKHCRIAYSSVPLTTHFEE